MEPVLSSLDRELNMTPHGLKTTEVYLGSIQLYPDQGWSPQGASNEAAVKAVSERLKLLAWSTRPTTGYRYSQKMAFTLTGQLGALVQAPVNPEVQLLWYKIAMVLYGWPI